MALMVRGLVQAVMVVLLCGGAVVLWALWVPASHPLLARAGLGEPLARIGIAITTDTDIEGGAARGGPPGGFGRGALSVVTAPVVLAELNDRVAAIGTGEALRSVELLPEVSGRVAELHVASGEHVEAGALIARLDDAAERIALDRAEILLDEARNTAARLERLQTTGTATEVQIREAALAVRTAELGLRQAEFDLARRQIVAPIAGWIGILEAEIGAQVGPGTVLGRIDDRSRILIDFSVPERLVGRIAPGDALDVAPLARPEANLSGRVRAVDSRVDQASRSLRVLAEIANPDDTLRAGMAFSIALSFPGEPMPAVDPLSIQWGNEGAFVWVVREGRVARVPVRILQRSEGLVLLRAELAPGERVVREGVQSLREGSEVREHDGAAAAAPPPEPQRG
ncbi:MAG: efflux RND transporter periplasmic adaptor subunit [Pararhodobacter sp.]